MYVNVISVSPLTVPINTECERRVINADFATLEYFISIFICLLSVEYKNISMLN